MRSLHYAKRRVHFLHYAKRRVHFLLFLRSEATYSGGVLSGLAGVITSVCGESFWSMVLRTPLDAADENPPVFRPDENPRPVFGPDAIIRQLFPIIVT